VDGAKKNVGYYWNLASAKQLKKCNEDDLKAT
jgi:hypothetical protein